MSLFQPPFSFNSLFDPPGPFLASCPLPGPSVTSYYGLLLQRVGYMFFSRLRIPSFSSLLAFPPFSFLWGGQRGIHVSDFIIIFVMSELCWFSKNKILNWALILNFYFYAVSPLPVFPLITAYKTLPQFVLSLTLPLLKSFSSLNYILSFFFSSFFSNLPLPKNLALLNTSTRSFP